MYFFILLGIIWYITPGYDLFIKMITLDSSWSAITFLTNYYNNDITESQIINKSSSLYSGSLTDRYICYISLYLLHTIICIFFQLSIFHPLYWCSLFLTIPSILNKILTSSQYGMIKTKKEYYIKIICAKLFATGIKKISKIYLHEKIKIKYTELMPFITNYKDAVNYITEILKNVAIILIIGLIRRNCKTLYYRMTKYLYIYKSGESLTTFNNKTSTELLHTTIKQRQWNEFLKPNIYGALIYLFNNQQNTGNLDRILIRYNYNIVKFFTLWTIASLIDYTVIIPIISSLILFYKIPFNWTDIIIKLCITIIGYLSGSIILTCFLCEFGKTIITNKLTIKLFNKIKKNIKFINKQQYIITFFKLLIVGLINNNWYLPLLVIECFNIDILSILLILTTWLNPINLIINTSIIYICYELTTKDIIQEKLKELLTLIKQNMIDKTTKYDQLQIDIFSSKIEHNDFINAITTENTPIVREQNNNLALLESNTNSFRIIDDYLT